MRHLTKNNKAHFHKQLPAWTIAMVLGAFMCCQPPVVHAGAGSDRSPDEDTPTDTQISSFVQMEFIVQDGVNWNDIDVETNEGVVILSGTVENILAKERSVNIAKAIKGVRAVVDKIQVRDIGIPDETLRQNITKALLMDPATDSYEIDVATSDGKITLSGEVDSWQGKELAAKVAKGVKGVRSLDNNIYFEYDKNRTDRAIREDIKQTLRWDIRIEDGLINVEVDDGMVTLVGAVGSVSEQSQAKVDAWVAGVKDVDVSKLVVSQREGDDEMRENKYVHKSDEEIKKAVEAAFLYDPRIMSFNPEVHVSNGRVTLTGQVDNLKAKKSAEIDAKNVVGVWNVVNLLKVSGGEDLASDLAITEDVSDALSLNPYIDNYDIGVIVDDGIVTLSGQVDNYLEKFQAEDVASAINGVKEVNNALVVSRGTLPYAYDYNQRYYFPYGRDSQNTYSPARSDRQIKEEIENQIWWSPFVNLSDVTVEVDDGIASLKGNVDSWNEYYLAEKNAFEGGALGVDNDLNINIE